MVNENFRRSVTTSIATLVAALAIFVQADATLAKPVKSVTENKAASSSGWRISFFPGQVSSASTVYLSKDALKIATEGSFEVVAKAPTWTATVTNKKTKLSCDLPVSKWRKDGFFLDRPDAKEYMNPKDAHSTDKLNFRGLQSQKRIWQTLESDQFYRYRTAPKKCLIELISTDGSIPCSTMQCELLSSWYGIPNLDGIPLFWQNRIGNESSLRLRVKNVERAVLGPEVFVPTKGTKKEASMMKLVDNKYKTAITDFIEFDNEHEIEKEKAKQSKAKKAPDK